MPASASSQPSSSPSFQRIAKSVRDAREGLATDRREANRSTSRGKSSAAAGRRQRPHVLEPEVARELVDAPRPGGVRASQGASMKSSSFRDLTITYIHACKFTKRPRRRRDDRAVAARPRRSGAHARGAHCSRRRRAVSPAMATEPPARGGRPRGGLHARRALSPVQGQGGPGPGGHRLGRRELDEQRSASAAKREQDPSRRVDGAGARPRRLLPAGRRPGGDRPRVEFSGHDHPVGREIQRIYETGIKRVARLVTLAAETARSRPDRPPERLHWPSWARSRAL